MFVVVSYDITDDKRRNRIAKTLIRFGDRVQESVFEMNMELDEFERMINQLKKRLDKKEDSVRIYKLCDACKPKTTILGCGTISEDPDIVVI